MYIIVFFYILNFFCKHLVKYFQLQYSNFGGSDTMFYFLSDCDWRYNI